MITDEPKNVVDKLITADFVVTMNPTYDIYAPGAVAVTADSIVTVGSRDALTAAYAAKERLDLGNAVVMPGLINTHGHAPMTLLRASHDPDVHRQFYWSMRFASRLTSDYLGALRRVHAKYFPAALTTVNNNNPAAWEKHLLELEKQVADLKKEAASPEQAQPVAPNTTAAVPVQPTTSPAPPTFVCPCCGAPMRILDTCGRGQPIRAPPSARGGP